MNFLHLLSNCGQILVLVIFFYLMFSLNSRTFALFMASVFVIQILSPIVLTTHALNTTYYVDAVLGSDANSGGF